MITVWDIYHYIDQIAPFDTAMGFDNVGLLVGDATDPVTGILLALDITPAVVREAASRNANLIVSHHPVIFQPLKQLPKGHAVYQMAQSGIAAICAHTNLDLANNGVNRALAERLGLDEIGPLTICPENGLPYSLSGKLKRPCSPQEFAAHVRMSLHTAGVKFVDGKRPVQTVAVCSGAGSDQIFAIAEQKIDAFVTGESKHHELLAADQMGVTMIDAGHFATEDVVIDALLPKLRTEFPELAVYKSEKMQDVVHYSVIPEGKHGT